jgi:hypothetical protein
MHTHRFVLLVALLLFVTVATQAQSNSHGYLLAAPGGTSSNGTGGGTLHIAGGADGVFTNGASVGAEVGYLLPFRDTSSGLGLFSVNGGYHFLKSGSKTVPFITGGYTGFFRSGYANGVNFGGGVNYWFKERMGLRVEFRDNVALFDSSYNVHFLNVRVGLAFR